MSSRLSVDLLLGLKRQYNLSAFLETGTSIGETAALAARHFPKVFTVEISPETFTAAQTALCELDNVLSELGSSPAFIREVLRDNPDDRFLFWLDGHWCGGEQLGPECPILFELAEIAPVHRNHVVLIDDARLFTSPPLPPHDPYQWPTFDTIKDIFASWEPAPSVRIEHDIIIEEPT